eukprot:4380048-Amphidinium_carterae.1
MALDVMHCSVEKTCVCNFAKKVCDCIWHGTLCCGFRNLQFLLGWRCPYLFAFFVQFLSRTGAWQTGFTCLRCGACVALDFGTVCLDRTAS